VANSRNPTSSAGAGGRSPVVCHALGLRFSVRADDDALQKRLGELLSHLAAPTERPQFAYAIGPEGLYLDDECLRGALDATDLVDYLLWHVNQMVASHSGDYLLLHAGAVELASRCVLLPAPPESGKSTLVAALVASGFGYLSDEIAAVDPATTAVLPYQKPLSLSRSACELFPQLAGAVPVDGTATTGATVHVDPDALRPGAAGSACRARLVLFPEYRHGGLAGAVPISRAEAVAALSRNSFNFAADPRLHLRVLARAVEAARCFRLTVVDVGEACATVRRLLDEQIEDPAHG